MLHYESELFRNYFHPDGNCFKLLQQQNAGDTGNTPIIMLAARCEWGDRIVGKEIDGHGSRYCFLSKEQSADVRSGSGAADRYLYLKISLPCYALIIAPGVHQTSSD